MMRTRNLCSLLSFVLMFMVMVSCGNSRKERADKPAPDEVINEEKPEEKPKDEPARKPKITGILVRLTGDNGVSIIDGRGNVLARNFTPFVNKDGKVDDDYTSPVIEDVFCVHRYSSEYEEGREHSTITVYRGTEDPRPVEGLTGLYSATIVYPDLFPICKYGERIKFVDRNGNVKFTVMPIDGMEPCSVYPYKEGGLFFVRATDYSKTKGGMGAIDSSGNWIIRPEWDRLNFMNPLTGERLLGKKGDKWYHINPATGSSSLLDINASFDLFSQDYFFEEVNQQPNYSVNVYDFDGRYITAIDSAYRVYPCWSNNHLIQAENPFYRGEALIDFTNGNRLVSRYYSYIDELSNGDFLARDHNVNGGYKCYYLKSDGSDYRLPDNTENLFRKAAYLLILDSDPFMFVIDDTNGYLCDKHGNKVGNYTFEVYFCGKARSVQSSYWEENIGNRSN